MGTIKHSINVLNTLRYSSDWGSSYFWKAVSGYDGQSNKFNCFGMSSSTYNASLIQIPAFSFTGKGDKLAISFYLYHKETHTYRWALCTSMENKASYQKTKSAVTDRTQIACGTFKLTVSSDNYYVTTGFEITADIPANVPLYLYIWAYEAGGVAPHIINSQDITVTLTYSEGLVYIDSGSGLEAYQPYIDNGSGWDLCQPYVDNGSGWDLMA